MLYRHHRERSLRRTFIPAILLLLTVRPAAAQTSPAYVQSASGNDHYSSSSASAQFAGSVTANDAIAVLCAWKGVAQTLNSVTDTQGNTYTILDNPTTGAYGRAAMAYAVARSSGPDTVSCNFSTAAMGKSVVAHEISGVDTAAPIDAHRMNVQAGPGTGANAVTSGSITTPASGDYLLGFTYNDSSNAADWNAGTGYVRRQDLRVASYTTASEDRIQPAAGSAAATFTATSAGFGEFISGILAFRPRQGAGTPPALTSIAVTPANPSIAGGTTRQFAATGTYSDGSTQNLTGTATWTSSNSTVATVNSTGLATSGQPGATTIQAASAGISGSTTLTVTAPSGAAPVSMYIDFEGAPDGTTINASVLAASTRCGNGTWSYFTHNPMTGMIISTTAQKRLVSPVTTCGVEYTDAAGTRGLRYDMSQTGRSVYYTWPTGPTASSTASAGFFYKIGVVDDNWYSVFAITAQGHDFTMLHMHGGDMYLETWAGITNPIPIAPNAWYWITMQYNAGGTHYLRVYDTANWTLLGSAQNVSTGNWKPDGIELGRTGSEPGYPASYWYYDQIVVDYATGRFPLLQGAPASLTSLAVTPASPSIPEGAAQAFTATGTYGDGSTRDITSSISWSSSDTTIALIAGSGVATGQAPGATTITAASGSISGSTTLTITAAAPPPAAVVAYVQSASANDHYSTASASVRFPDNVTATNAIAVLCVWQGLSQTLTGVTDTQGNTYTVVDNPTSGTYGRAAMAYAIARSSAPDTVSCNFSTAGMGKSVVVHEIGGVNATTPLDGHRMTVRAGPGTGANAITSGPIQTTANGGYILGFTFNDSSNAAAWNAGSGYARRQDLRVASYTTASEDRIQSAAGPVEATFTATTAGFGEFITGILAFRPR